MSEWKEYKLEEVAENFAMGPFGSNIKAENFKESGVPVIRGSNLNFFRYVGGNFVFLNEEKADQLKSSNCFPRDLVFTHRGTIGQVGIVPEGKYQRYVVSQSGMKLSVKKSCLDHQFLFYFFKSRIGQHELLQNESQVGVPSISSPLTSLKSVTILLPPLPEQRAIASVLSSLDDKIDLLHRQNKTLEATAETLFRQWFVEEADEGWEWVKLGQFIEVMRGLSYKGAGLAEKGNGVPMHNLNSVYEGGGYKYEGIKYYSGDYKGRHLVKPGDVIITNTEQGHDLLLIGYPAIVSKYFGDFGIFSQHIYRLRLKDKRITEPFLYYLLMSYDVREQLAGATNGSTVNMLPKDGIEWAKFKTPPDEKIKEFTSIVKPLLGKKESNYSQIRTLEKLRDTLLPKLMSGEVRIEMGGIKYED